MGAEVSENIQLTVDDFYPIVSPMSSLRPLVAKSIDVSIQDLHLSKKTSTAEKRKRQGKKSEILKITP